MMEHSVGELLEDKVEPDIEGMDRIYLNAYQPRLQTGGGVVGFFREHRGAVVASTTLMAPMSKAFVADIRRLAKREGIEIVHFERVTVEAFANWLAQCDARLVYLSSCHSSEKGFVFDLANKLVPAVVGFRWKIKDRLATEYAKCFYERLFDSLSLEQAFLRSRRAMHESYEREPIWASPILVVQAAAA